MPKAASASRAKSWQLQLSTPYFLLRLYSTITSTSLSISFDFSSIATKTVSSFCIVFPCLFAKLISAWNLPPISCHSPWSPTFAWNSDTKLGTIRGSTSSSLPHSMTTLPTTTAVCRAPYSNLSFSANVWTNGSVICSFCSDILTERWHAFEVSCLIFWCCALSSRVFRSLSSSRSSTKIPSARSKWANLSRIFAGVISSIASCSSSCAGFVLWVGWFLSFLSAFPVAAMLYCS